VGMFGEEYACDAKSKQEASDAPCGCQSCRRRSNAACSSPDSAQRIAAPDLMLTTAPRGVQKC
jgi:hypothetical protein